MTTNSQPAPPLNNDPLAESELDNLRRSQRLWDSSRDGREEFFRTVLKSLGEGLLITDDQSRIVYANSRLSELTGYSKDELIGRTSYEVLLPPEEWPRQRDRLTERLSGKCETYEHQIIRKNGQRHWVRVRATPNFNAAGKIVGTIGSLTCVEDKKALEFETPGCWMKSARSRRSAISSAAATR